MLLYWKLQWILIFHYNCIFPYFWKCLENLRILAKSTLHCLWQIHSNKKTLFYYRFLTYFRCSFYQLCRFLAKTMLCLRHYLSAIRSNRLYFESLHVEIGPRRTLSSTCSMTAGVMKWCYHAEEPLEYLRMDQNELPHSQYSF